MSKLDKINELKTLLTEETQKPNRDEKKIGKIKQQIIILGMQLTPWDFNRY